MKQFIISISVSLIALYLIVAFIGLKPNVFEWEMGGRAAYILFGLFFGVVAYLIHGDYTKSNNNKPTRF
jgi:phage shock protein PspC (stress-responsive transcriptional regulator)